MKKIINTIYQNNSIIYKVFLFIVTTVLVVYFFPKGGKFKYEFQKGKPWQYENLYAPFDFAIQKSPERIAEEKAEIAKNAQRFFAYDLEVVASVQKAMTERFQSIAGDSLYSELLVEKGAKILSVIYKNGFLETASESKITDLATTVVLRKGNEISEMPFGDFLFPKELFALIQEELEILQVMSIKKF